MKKFLLWHLRVDYLIILHPKVGLSRCEWGKDDFSSQVENLPKAPPPRGQMDLLSLEGD